MISYFCTSLKTEITMWQRIQTLYLLVSTILIFALLFSVKAAVYGADGTAVQEFSYSSYIPYLILLIVITFLHLVALISCKILVFQMRTAILAALVEVALQLWIVVDFISTHDSMVFRYTAVFPVIALILDVLAARGILADQMLVESASHLRKARRERRK